MYNVLLYACHASDLLLVIHKYILFSCQKQKLQTLLVVFGWEGGTRAVEAQHGKVPKKPNTQRGCSRIPTESGYFFLRGVLK